jgi:hypothetical protein
MSGFAPPDALVMRRRSSLKASAQVDVIRRV